MKFHSETTPAQLALSLKVQVAAEYLRYLDKPEHAAADDDVDWATTRLESIVAEANACEVRGAVVRGVGVETMARLWGMGLDEEIMAEKEILR